MMPSPELQIAHLICEYRGGLCLTYDEQALIRQWVLQAGNNLEPVLLTIDDCFRQKKNSITNLKWLDKKIIQAIARHSNQAH